MAMIDDPCTFCDTVHTAEEKADCVFAPCLYPGWAPAPELCDHVGTGRVTRTCHGYLGDKPAGTTETLCVECGAEISDPVNYWSEQLEREAEAVEAENGHDAYRGWSFGEGADTFEDGTPRERCDSCGRWDGWHDGSCPVRLAELEETMAEEKAEGVRLGPVPTFCPICGDAVTYPDGVNLKGGRTVHQSCARANLQGGKVRVPR
jgi:hypothetical protein